MSWEPVSLAHWEASLKAHAQAQQQSDARDWTNRGSNMKPKIILLGHGRHGKDTVAELLRDRYGYRFQSSSYACAEHVMLPYFESQGVHYESVDACYADRHSGNNREIWFQQIRAFNTPDPARLIRQIYDAGNDVYVGMRNSAEFAEAKKLADIVLWVDASGRGMPLEGRGSFDIDYDPETMQLIENNGTLEDLQTAVDWFEYRRIRK